MPKLTTDQSEENINERCPIINGTSLLHLSPQTSETILEDSAKSQKERSGRTREKLSSGYDRTTSLRNSQKLWLPAEDLKNTKLNSIQ